MLLGTEGLAELNNEQDNAGGVPRLRLERNRGGGERRVTRKPSHYISVRFSRFFVGKSSRRLAASAREAS
jgi:hypothetical protein